MRLESWSRGCERSRSKKVLELLRILEGRVSVGLNGLVVLRTMAELCFQPLKLWACLLCDFTGVGDLSREFTETLEAGEVTKWVAKLVTPTIIVVVENAVEAI